MAVRFFCTRIITVSHSYISLHVLPCRTLSCLTHSTQPFQPSFASFSQVSRYAMPSIIERSGERVTEWLRQPHVLSSLLLRRRPSVSLPPVLLLFLLISSQPFATALPSLSSVLYPCSSLSKFLRVLPFHRPHPKYDEETEGEIESTR